VEQASQAAEKVFLVILSDAKNLSSISALTKNQGGILRFAQNDKGFEH
jgi:hypothetical protein